MALHKAHSHRKALGPALQPSAISGIPLTVILTAAANLLLLPLLVISSSRSPNSCPCWHTAQARDSSPDAEQTSIELNAMGKRHNALLTFLKREKGAQDDALDNNHYYAWI